MKGSGSVRFLQAALFWAGWFVAYLVIIVGIGAVVGTSALVLLGPLFVEESRADLALRGLRYGAQYFGVWAPSLSIVLCVMKAWRRANNATSAAGSGGPKGSSDHR